jgi:heat shock protein HslJ
MLLGALLIGGCQSLEDQPITGTTTQLEDKEWTLIALNGKAFIPQPNQPVPTLKLEAAVMKASGSSGLNRFSAGYVLDGSMLKFGPAIGTKMAGPPESMATEAEFLTALGAVTNWRFSDSAIELRDGGKTVLRFAAKQ